MMVHLHGDPIDAMASMMLCGFAFDIAWIIKQAAYAKRVVNGQFVRRLETSKRLFKFKSCSFLTLYNTRR
jgi:hypothetical protein